MKRSEDYNVRYSRLSVRVEKLIITGIIMFACALFAGQSLYMFEPIRQVLIETENLEGTVNMP